MSIIRLKIPYSRKLYILLQRQTQEISLEPHLSVIPLHQLRILPHLKNGLADLISLLILSGMKELGLLFNSGHHGGNILGRKIFSASWKVIHVCGVT